MAAYGLLNSHWVNPLPPENGLLAALLSEPSVGNYLLTNVTEGNSSRVFLLVAGVPFNFNPGLLTKHTPGSHFPYGWHVEPDH